MRSWEESRSFLCMKVGVVRDNCETQGCEGSCPPKDGPMGEVAYFDARRRIQQISDGLEAADTAHRHHSFAADISDRSIMLSCHRSSASSSAIAHRNGPSAYDIAVRLLSLPTLPFYGRKFESLRTRTSQPTTCNWAPPFPDRSKEHERNSTAKARMASKHCIRYEQS